MGMVPRVGAWDRMIGLGSRVSGFALWVHQEATRGFVSKDGEVRWEGLGVIFFRSGA